jgi:predicted DNA-binding antitoxin AbrB/MazE fold protein
MSERLKAIYRDGVFVPRVPCDLPEGTEVEVLKSNPQRVAPLDCSRELNWLEMHGAEYEGQWVALSGDQLISHGTSGLEVYESARRAGIESPFLIQVEIPEDELPFGGW